MRKSYFSADGGDVDNRSVTARQHLRQNRERGMQCSEEVYVHRFLKAGQGLAFQRPYHDDPCIVHHHVNLAEVGSCCGDDLLDLGWHTYIRSLHPYIFRRYLASSYQASFCGLKIVVVSGSKGQPRAQRSQLQGDGVAQTSRPARDQYHLTLEFPNCI